jgi:ferritin-like metal-binding protein YciE
MKVNTFEDLFVHSLKDLYSAEKQLAESLPKMAKAAVSDELRRAFKDHLGQTQNQISRIESIFADRQKSPRGEKCVGMEGLIEEGQKVIESEMEGAVRDAALIAAAQRVEHYEIAGYGTARAFAEILGEENAYSLLSQSLEEESQTNENLTSLAKNMINIEALS